METLHEKIQMSLDTSAIKANSLSALVSELKTVDGLVEQIYTRLGKGPNIGAAWLQSVEQMKSKLDKTFKVKGPYAATDVLKAVGLDEANVNQALARLNQLGTKLTGFKSKSGTFTTTSMAATGIARVMKEEIAAMNQAIAGAQTAIGKALRGQGPQGATFSGKDFAVKVDGLIGLVIPGTQVQASVSGPITLKVGEVGGQRSEGGGRDPATGQFLPGAGGGKKKSTGGAAQPLEMGPVAGETGRVRTERLNKGIVESRQEAITRMTAAGEAITDTFDSVEGLIKTVEKSTTGQSPLGKFRQARALMTEQFRAQKAWLDPEDMGHGLAALYAKQGSAMRGMAAMEGGKYLHPALAGLPTPIAAQAAALLGAGAHTLDERSLAATRMALAPGQAMLGALRSGGGTMATANWLNFFQGTQGLGVPVNVGTGMSVGAAGSMRAYYTKQATSAAKAAARAAAPPKNLGSPQWQGNTWQLGSGQSPAALALLNGPMLPAAGPGIVPSGKPPGLPPAKPGRISAAMQASFTPESMLVHTIKAAGWAAAITAIYKPIQLAEYSLKRFLDLSDKTAHLSVIFRGVGGSAKELTDDVIKLAAANGRSADEAMESATEWARLGLTRVQINQAVQTSLEAANVAQISVGEATKQMSALMHIYGMNVGQVEDALGTLVNTSQKFNVTTEDLLGGLDRSAAAAKLAGVSFAELQGLIGATAGGTGQSGVQIGNTIKNLLTQFTRPEIQNYLQTQGIGTRSGGGFGSGSEVLRRMFIQYQKMDPTQQRNLGTVIAGRLQTARFAGLMNEYPEAQRLAIDGLLRQNAALNTNLQIIQTLRAQVHGLGAEWDRFVLGFGGTTGGRGVNPTSTVQLWKNVLTTANNWGVGGALGAGLSEGAVKGILGQGLGTMALDVLPSINLLWSGALSRRGPGDLGGQFNRSARDQEAAQLMQRQMETAAELQHAGLTTEGAKQAMSFARESMGRLGLPAGASFEQGSAAAQTRQVDDLVAKMKTMAQMKVEADQKHAAGGSQEDYAAQLAQIEKLGNAERAEADAVLSEVSEQIARKQEYVNLLKEQQSVMEVIGRLAAQVPTGTLTGEMGQQSAALRSNIDSLQAQMKAVAESSPVGVEQNPVYQQLAQELATAKAQLATNESPRYRQAVEAYDNRAVAIRRATAESSSYAVGYTESEKLLRQQAALEGELRPLARKREAGTATDNDLVRGLQLQVELAKDHEQIQMRIVELKGQEKQILIEANREYQKAMLMSGPGELLKRLYAGSRGAMSAGQFMSMDPEARRFYYEQRGGEAGARNREEQALLRGRDLTVTGEQAQAGRDRAEVNRWSAAQRNPVAGMAGLPPPASDPLMTQAMKSAAALSEFTTRLLTASDAMAAFTEALSRVQGGSPAPAAPPPAPSRGLDISPGHALGSTPPAAATDSRLPSPGQIAGQAAWRMGLAAAREALEVGSPLTWMGVR